MSNRAITWALKQTTIPATAKWLLTVLCNAANDKENLTCRRSLSLLAAETNLNRVTVVHTIQDLIRNRKIEKIGEHSDKSSIYRVLVVVDNHGVVVDDNQQWLPRTTSCVGQLVADDNQNDCVQQPPLVADDNSASCVRQHITKETKGNQITKGDGARVRAGSHPDPAEASLEKPKPRPRDLAADFFSEQCLKHTGTPYLIEAGDMVQMARLRKAFGTPNLEKPPKWDQSCENYFASPLAQYSLADLANPKRYSVFQNSPLDGFNKPINHHNRNGSSNGTNFRDNGNSSHKQNPATIKSPRYIPKQ